MLYKPGQGRMKDNWMAYHDGVFYMYSMHRSLKDTGRYKNIWLAISDDGVHFKDYGCVVEDFPADEIFAGKVYRGDDAFYMNCGSFIEGLQVVLKFWKSDDLINWKYIPELDVVSPQYDKEGMRLDCMCVVKNNGRYYGYATGQYGFLTSDDGSVWSTHPANIDYTPFPTYNKALGGFEIADFIEIDGIFYMLCGGFGHLGMRGYGVYVYKSPSPEGPFAPCLPYYRINGTSGRWCNMWERCFKKDGQYLTHNYMYNGHTYENGEVYLPPLKKLQKVSDDYLRLDWWEGNDVLYGEVFSSHEKLTTESPMLCVFDSRSEREECDISSVVSLPENPAMIDLKLRLGKNTFAEYTKGGIYLAESKNSGSAILFDTYGKCEIAYVENGKIICIEDTIGFGSTAPYYFEDDKLYSVRIAERDGMFEIYVDNMYLQTFNNAHTPGSISKPFEGVGAVSVRGSCELSDLNIYNMNI